MSKETIKYLMDEFRSLEESDENKRRRSMWKELNRCSRDQWRGTPKSDRSWKKGYVPITADIQVLTWSKIFDFDVNDYYFDPEVFVENYLKIMIFRFKNFQDDTFLEKRLPIWGTTVLEGTLFGVEASFRKDFEPWISHTPIVNNAEDLKKIPMPDFKTSGIMPRLISMYEKAKELVDDDFEVLFPLWERGVLGISIFLHGFQETLIDMVLQPEFMHEMFRFITDARKKWYDEYYLYTGNERHKADIFNDEVSVPSISPAIYDEMIFPYENEIAQYHGGLYYWHSCGDVTKLVDGIARLEGLDMFNVGPWTDIYEAGRAFRNKAPIEIAMNAEQDIIRATPEHMRKKITSVIESCARSDVAGMCMKISALNAPDISKIDHVYSQIRQWIQIAREVTQKGIN